MNPDIQKRINAMRWRGKLEPTVHLPGTMPFAMTSSNCRRIVQHLFDNGGTFHTSLATGLWVNLDFLHSSQVPYTLKFMPGEGFLIELTKETK